MGYARVSTDQQKLDLQLSALKKVGCNRIYQDHGSSGHGFQREGLDAALGSLRPGGTLVVWRLDRLGRSLLGLVQFIDQLGKRGVNFQSIMENIETGSSGGRLMFHMMAALAEFERSLISDRTRAGLKEARARGQLIGRPSALTKTALGEALTAVYRNGASTSEVAKQFGVSVRTIQRHIRGARENLIDPIPTCDHSADNLEHVLFNPVHIRQP